MNSHYNTDALCDAVVVCEDREFQVHRVILSAHSEYFAKALGGAWKVSWLRMSPTKEPMSNGVQGEH